MSLGRSLVIAKIKEDERGSNMKSIFNLFYFLWARSTTVSSADMEVNPGSARPGPARPGSHCQNPFSFKSV